MTGWGDSVASWWFDEVATDVGYAAEVLPLALGLLDPGPDQALLDVGCGEGRIMRVLAAVGARPFGCDLSAELLAVAAETGPVVRCELPSIAWAGDGVFDGAVIVLVLEHLAAVDGLFSELHRVVRSGGHVVAVVNHPVLTSPDSGPIIDPDDEEVLWRWGDYFGFGATHEPTGAGSITFHHRSTAALLTTVAEAGWSLETMVEAPVGEERRRADPLLHAQADVPRLLGVRWRRGEVR